MNDESITSDSREFLVRPGTLDASIVEWVHGKNEYRLPQQFAPNTVVIDIGAHIGAFTLAAVDRGAQHVVAVEAMAENRVLAFMNMREEIRQGQVDLIFAAVADPSRAAVAMTPGEYLDGSLNTGSHRIAVARPTDAGAVPVVTLETLLTKAREHFADDEPGHLCVKLDCEGSEWEILGTSESLSDFEMIVGEFHERPGEVFGPQRPCTSDGLTDHLRAAGFETALTATTPGLGLFWAWPRRSS
ncbi:MAG TPA: FkbM family methyltransferase [Ilumatobacteraceae bacterium]|nr:FkbM family methyltransferase [Ilumatobacteraceae bacterium]HRB02364.1 FkbM family methyltransferase [Ilumatobacteraceae bacterium]